MVDAILILVLLKLHWPSLILGNLLFAFKKLTLGFFPRGPGVLRHDREDEPFTTLHLGRTRAPVRLRLRRSGTVVVVYDLILYLASILTVQQLLGYHTTNLNEYLSALCCSKVLVIRPRPYMSIYAGGTPAPTLNPWGLGGSKRPCD